MRLYHVAKPGNNKHYTTSPSHPMTNIISRRQASQRHKLYHVAKPANDKHYITSPSQPTTNIIPRRQAIQRQTYLELALFDDRSGSLVVRASASNMEVCLFETRLSHTKDL
ncbi:hypothetical protein CHS0354_005551 [Potamilus streckersoni]|uniref:Uncharacterized protein n=1 Tax=Potamilus streckersoni TaxID=2493646 RepID=A0AAE0RNG4_9BIVA|nr:hypothetical protein CHS0354_005551 [Potamilus streckersoni]